MMDDRTLLERAAAAAGIDGVYRRDRSLLPPEYILVDDNHDPYRRSRWNPLANDGDALRLAVKLDMQVEYLEFTGNARARGRIPRAIDRDWCVEYCMDSSMRIKDPCVATRRAIVRAAAALAGD